MIVTFHPKYELALKAGHKFPMQKYGFLVKQLVKDGYYGDKILLANRLRPEIAGLAHNKDYLNKLIQRKLSEREIRKTGFPMNIELIEREFLVSGGTFDATLHAVENELSFNTAGGTHHAFMAHGEGFCLLNDVAISSIYLHSFLGIKKILIVDLDVHQGNGTASILEQIDDIYTFSMHGRNNYPLIKEKSDLDIELDDNCSGEKYLKLLVDSLEKIVQIFKVEFIFYNAGVDILDTDKLGKVSLSLEDCKERDKIVFSFARNNGVPIVTVMGGGYSESIQRIVSAHMNTFLVAKEVYRL